MGEIPLFEIPWNQNEIKYVIDSVTRGGYWAKGPYVDKFEESLAEYIGVEHAVTVNSGTTALVTALEAHGIGEGDEVIVPSFTFIATANAVRLVGAEPVFADIKRETLGLDPEAVEQQITTDTAALLPVHCHGRACDIGALKEVASANDLVLIEDAAAALGATVDGEKVGTVGDSAALSFCQNKIVTTGEGGAVVTDDDEVAETARLYRSHGRASADYFESADSGSYVCLGSNYRLADVNAAIGCAQLERVETLIDGRRHAAGRMTEGLSPLDGVEPFTDPTDGRHVYQLYTVVLDDSIDRDRVIASLYDDEIASKTYWDPPVHRSEYYRTTSPEIELAVTEDIAGRVLSLPIHPEISEESTGRIVESIAKTL